MIQALCLALAPLLQAPDRGAPLVLRTYDLDAVVPTYEDGNGAQILAPVLIGTGRQREAAMDGIGIGRPSDQLASFLHQLFEGELGNVEGAYFELDQDGRLTVRASAAFQKALEISLARLADVFRRPILLRIDLVRAVAPQGPASSMLKEDEVERWLASVGSQNVRTELVRLGSGVSGSIQDTRQRRLLIEHDVEIAQLAAMSDPVSRVCSLGFSLEVRAASAPGGARLWLTFSDGSEQAATERRSAELNGSILTERGLVSIGGLEELDVPHFAHAAAALTSFLAPGQALVLSQHMDARLGDIGATLVVRLAGPVPQAVVPVELPDRGSVYFIERSAFEPGELEIETPIIERYAYLAQDGSGALRVSSLAPFVLARFAQRDSGLTQDFAVNSRDLLQEQIGAWLVLGPLYDLSSGSSNEPDPQLAQLARKLQNFDLHVTLRRSGAEIARWNLATLEGADCAGSIGAESLAVSDYDVEVAQGASIADPVVELLFEGALFQARTARGPDGTAVLEFQALARLPAQASALQGKPLQNDQLPGSPHDELHVEGSVRFSKDEKNRKAWFGDVNGLAFEVELR